MTIGNVTTVRWLNTAVTICRIYLSVHGLNARDTKNLNLIIVFIVAYYFPMYFYIKVSTQHSPDPELHPELDNLRFPHLRQLLITSPVLSNTMFCYLITNLINIPFYVSPLVTPSYVVLVTPTVTC